MTIGDGIAALGPYLCVVGLAFALAWGLRGLAASEARETEARYRAARPAPAPAQGKG